MRLLFISYWSITEPLTSSTIMPYLRMMADYPHFTSLILATVERGDGNLEMAAQEIPGLRHIPLRMRFRRLGPLSKLDLFLRAVWTLARVVRKEKIDLLDAKASQAGAIAHVVGRLTRTPYMIESFEPHSAYMEGCGVWSGHSLYYRTMRWLEQVQKKHARLLVTVTRNYRERLIEEGVPKDRIRVIPSIVDTARFAFNAARRKQTREQLGWEQDAPVGIYVGKFGGLYYDEEAFAIFRKARDIFGERFRLIILSIDPHRSIMDRLAAVGFPADAVHVGMAKHEEVPQWLSAADMAFSTIRQMPAGLFQSPVKNGEYWANGLPILLTDKVSDDHGIILEHPWAGALFNVQDEKSIDDALRHMHQLVTGGVDRQRIMDLAERFRSIRIAREIYDSIFGDGRAGNGSMQADSEAPTRPAFK